MICGTVFHVDAASEFVASGTRIFGTESKRVRQRSVRWFRVCRDVDHPALLICVVARKRS